MLLIESTADTICRCLGFAGITPPATLTVTARNVSINISVPVLDYNFDAWKIPAIMWDASAVTNIIANRAAGSFDVVQLMGPNPSMSPDWSFDLQFYCPSVQCNLPNSTQQSTFNTLIHELEKNEKMFVSRK